MANDHPSAPTVRWIGPSDAAEFAGCYKRALASAEEVESNADLTVLACPRPMADPQVAQALITDPEGCSIVQLLGVWCEGEGRTGRVVDGLERVFWHQWPAWWDRWLAERGETEEIVAPIGLVRIDTPDAEVARAVIDCLDRESVSAVWRRGAVSTTPDLILWDGSQLGGREADRLAAACREARATGAAVVAMLDFPRPATAAAALAIGASAVVGKPLDRDDLIATLQVVAPRGRAVTAPWAPSEERGTPIAPAIGGRDLAA